MALVLDTAELPAADRAEALREGMRVAGVPANVTPLPAHDVSARLQLWELDDAGSTLMQRDGTGIWLERTARHVRVADPDRVGLTLLPAGRWTFHQFRSDHAEPATPSLVLVHQGSAYDHRRWDSGTTIAINMDRAVLDVPVDTVIEASRNLSPDAPLHALACAYLTSLARTAREAPEALPGLAATTVTLVRAVICAAGGDARQRQAMQDSLFDRIRLFVQSRLTDPALGPEMIAAAHHISVRQLYNVWARHRTEAMSLADWILVKRLESARDQLSDPGSDHVTVANIARRSGFSDPTHFGRRFRARYGVTPREYRMRRRASPAG